MKDELAARVRIPYDYLRTGRELMKRVVPLYVSMENPWTINKDIVFSSLRLSGIEMTDDSLYLPANALSGPNFEYEARLIRFYVVLSNQYIVPMLGRVSHISADDSKQVLYPGSDQSPTAEQLAKHGLREESAYFHDCAEVAERIPDVFEFMQSR
uniref:Bestrophin homolog n=1 Tax=Steinernema glaseri TaxID=37863 RepID=A0A1I8A604_9BILA